MTTYLITGVGGFVGTNLLDLLNNKKEQSDVIYGVSRSLNKELLDKHPTLNYKKCNLQNYNSVAEIINQIRPDYIFHLASDSSVAASWESPLKILNNNIDSHVNLCEAVRRSGLS
jgi:GDP-4-dehydro-6-deoxy-D-mannose reductase